MVCVKLLHLSDLHIGKRVNECSMLEDQRYILEQIAQLAIERKVDGVLLAGDLYDKPVPPAEAVILLDTFFTALSLAGIPVFAISGNHDSPERLSFGARLLTGTGIYLSAVYQGPQEPVLLRDAYGEVAIYLLPYLKPALVRHSAPEAEIATYQDAVSYALQQWTVPPSRRNVLVAHQFVTGGTTSESEEHSVGGLDYAQLIVEQAAAQGIDMPLLASDTWDSNVILGAAKGKDVKVYVTTFYAEGGNAEFEKGFKEWIKSDSTNLSNNGGNDIISAVSVMGYDAYYTALEALKAAGSTNPQDVMAALPGVKYTGITGEISFNEEGDANRDSAFVKTANTESGLWDFVTVQGIDGAQ